ncbi:alkaline phosphatase, tissue-nonspecific isozyme-like [Ptychodera flava]|uniref:alkaline phosphatase, tissue-nonspecific isozyme-like n=1 Tax=Ptychodera flava TaxID=63121 RepID=UPI00396A6D44
MTNTTEDPEHSSLTGLRTDGRDLVSEWRNLPAFDGLRAEYVWKKDDFDAADPESTDYLFGLFEHSHMQYETDRTNDVAGEPGLAEMVEKAILMLSKNDEGFFLFVEGGRIDHAHHDTLAYKALVDTLAFDDAVKTALEMTDTEDTLVIVTADHSHVNTINGNPKRGNPILGKTGDIALDDLPYTTIMYTNGPSGKEVMESFTNNGTRPNITDVDTEAPDYLQQALIPLQWETHGGEDVSLHADGPYSHLFQNIHEQNYIAHVIKYAACLGEYADACDSRVSAGAYQVYMFVSSNSVA